MSLAPFPCQTRLEFHTPAGLQIDSLTLEITSYSVIGAPIEFFALEAPNAGVAAFDTATASPNFAGLNIVNPTDMGFRLYEAGSPSIGGEAHYTYTLGIVASEVSAVSEPGTASVFSAGALALVYALRRSQPRYVVW